MPWTETEDRALLLAVIQASEVSPNWKELAPGLGKTNEAIRQRFAKLKKEVQVPAASTDGDTGDAVKDSVANTLV